MIVRRTYFALLCAAAALSACDKESNLESRTETDTPRKEVKESAKAATPTANASETEPKSPGLDAETLKDNLEPPEGARTALLKLALAEGTTYRMTRVGFISLPAVLKPTGFAVESELTLSGCTGEGFERQCDLSTKFTNFEAEKPFDKQLGADHERVAEVIASHPLRADGHKAGPTELTGDLSKLADGEGDLYAEVHQLLCLRLPSKPVAEGASWNTECSVWRGGVLADRKLRWEVLTLEDDPEGGERVELGFAGTHHVEDSKGALLEGAVQGTVFFFVDDGEIHLARERFSVPSASGSSTTTTNLNIQFAKLDEKGNETRTDGKPFPKPIPRSPKDATPPKPDLK